MVRYISKMGMVTRLTCLLLLLAWPGMPANGVRSGIERGSPSAPLKIEVYTDFQCPACKQLHEGTLKQVITDYVDRGKAFLVYHDFQINPTHQYSLQAACFAEAAQRLGKYEVVADALFASQDSWSLTGDVDKAVTTLFSPADARRVRALARSPEVMAEVQKNEQLARSIPISQTPTMVVTCKGKSYSLPGAQKNYAMLRMFLDSLLK